MTTTIASPQNAVPGTTWRRGLLAQLGIDTAYVLLGFPLGVIAFVLVVTGLSLGIGLIPLMLIGIPILVGTVFIARGFAEVERSRVVPVLRQPRTVVRYRSAKPGADALRRVVAPLGDVQYWLDAIHAIARFPISTAGFSIVVSWWATALGGLTYGLWIWTVPESGRGDDLPTLLGFDDTMGTRIAFYAVVGVVFALTLPFVVRACALIEAWLAHALLNGVADLRDRITTQDGPQVGSGDRTAVASAS
jgi:hypothetical protein